MSKQIIHTHPSKQGVTYEWPLAAKRAGFEPLFLTGFYYKADKFPYTLAKFLPPGLRSKALASLKRRRKEGLEDASVLSISGPWLELATRPGRLFGNLSAPLVTVHDHLYDNLAARWIASSPLPRPGGILHGFQGSCLHSLRAAKARGLITVLELTLPPCGREIVARERRRLGLPAGESAPRPNELAEIREADYVVSQSYFSVECAIKLGGDEKRMIHLPLGGDLSRFTPRSQKRDERAPFQALFLGQISIRKGVHLLLQAWRELRLPNAKLVLAGELTDPDAARFLKRHEGDYSWVGFASHDRLPELYRESDVFVMPSLAEGGCNVIYEAMASGLPCIVSRHAGSVVVDGAQGRVVAVGDAEALKRALGELHADPALRERMGQAALERARRFTWLDFSRRLGKMYDAMTERKGAPFSHLLDLIDE